MVQNNSMEKEEFLKKRIRELANISFQRDIGTFSDFLTISEQDDLFKTLPPQTARVKIILWGGYEEAERRMAGFFPAEWESTPDFPVRCVKVAAAAPKFAGELTHRDYLGAILHLGTDRSVIGDILVQDGAAYVFCQEKIAPFLEEELVRVKHTDVRTKICAPDSLPAVKTVEVTDTAASLRLDVLVASAFRLSRSAASAQIVSGLVFVNGRQILSNSFAPKEGDIISLRHQGRFRFEEAGSVTKKGRIRIRLSLYV